MYVTWKNICVGAVAVVLVATMMSSFVPQAQACNAGQEMFLWQNPLIGKNVTFWVWPGATSTEKGLMINTAIFKTITQTADQTDAIISATEGLSPSERALVRTAVAYFRFLYQMRLSQ